MRQLFLRGFFSIRYFAGDGVADAPFVVEDDELSDEPFFLTVEDLCVVVVFFCPPVVELEFVDDFLLEYVEVLSAGVGCVVLTVEPLASPTIGRPV